MKQIILILSCVIFASCTFVHTELTGLQGDTVKLSSNELFFGAEGGQLMVSTEGTSWFIDHSININDSCCYWLFDEDNFFIEVDSSSSRGYLDIVKIEGAWFTITRESRQEITFLVLPNGTGSVRKLHLGVWDHNFGTGVRVVQAAE
jgi:hypothetical protein